MRGVAFVFYELGRLLRGELDAQSVSRSRMKQRPVSGHRFQEERRSMTSSSGRSLGASALFPYMFTDRLYILNRIRPP